MLPLHLIATAIYSHFDRALESFEDGFFVATARQLMNLRRLSGDDAERAGRLLFKQVREHLENRVSTPSDKELKACNCDLEIGGQHSRDERKRATRRIRTDKERRQTDLAHAQYQAYLQRVQEYEEIWALETAQRVLKVRRKILQLEQWLEAEIAESVRQEKLVAGRQLRRQEIEDTESRETAGFSADGRAAAAAWRLPADAATLNNDGVSVSVLNLNTNTNTNTNPAAGAEGDVASTGTPRRSANGGTSSSVGSKSVALQQLTFPRYL